MAEQVMAGQVTDLRWGSLVLLGLLAIVFGFLVVLFPRLSIAVLMELIGIFVILLSFGIVLMSAMAPGGFRGSILPAVLGVIGFFIGIATILSPFVMGGVILTIAGVALFFAGLLGIVFAFAEKDIPRRGVFALQAVITLVLGVLIMIAPVVGEALLVLIIGAYFVVWGILSVAAGAMVRSARA